MIIGFDHIALSASDVDSERATLEKQGFHCLFLEKNIPNNAMKAKLLKHYHPFHEIGFFKPATGVSIEIINHGSIVQGAEGPYDRRDEKIVLRTADVKNESHFWVNALRFRQVTGSLLELTSPVPGWGVLLELTEDPSTEEKSTLDAAGYTCLALYTNDLVKDAGVAQTSGATDIAGPFDLEVNHKTLQLLMFRTPGGAICELIKPRRI